MDGHHHHDPSTKNIRAAFFLNLLFAFIELIGGFLTNSVAIISDAIHDLGDSISLGAAWYFQKISNRKRNDDFSYGYKRFTVLGAIVNAVIITVGSLFVISESIPRLFDPVMPDATGMIYLSIFGILVNGIAAARLFKGESMNERAVYLHLLEDVLGWIATLVVAIVLQFRAIPILDPILSLIIALYILYNVIKNLRQSINIILQGTPSEIKVERIHKVLKNFSGVLDIHDCHIWSMDGKYHVLSAHVVLEKSKSMEELAELKHSMKNDLQNLKIDHVTLEFELEEEECDPC